MSEEAIMVLIDRAKSSAEYAYVPYSSCPMGACVLTTDGLVFGGCTVENSSLGVSCDAGTVAILKAVSEGHPKIKALAIFSESMELIYPTGDCRQVLYEFADKEKTKIIVANKYSHEVYRLNEIFPFPFAPSDM